MRKTTTRADARNIYVLNWATALVFSAALVGCASPGPPLPPSLKLPKIPTGSGISAVRSGAAVTVRWTTPERTTDGLLIKGKVEAELCREVVRAAEQVSGAGQTTAQSPTSGVGQAEARPCNAVVAKAAAQPGAAGEITDTLPAELASGPAKLLAYRVQLRNAAGRTAGASGEVFAAGGDAPAAVADFRARAGKAGVVLEWKAEGSIGDAVELERTAVRQEESSGKDRNAKDRTAQIADLGKAKEPSEVQLRAGESGAADAGGVVDRSAVMGRTYSYTAWRVRTVPVGGREMEIRSAMSPAVTITMTDNLPPNTPTGLVAVPGLVGEESTRRSAIDLSWEPNDEPRIAGYRVYRRDAGETASGDWRLVSGEKLLPVAAYRDADVVAGRRYAYRVTAVGLNGMESQRSNEASESAPSP
jgi:hypothetical protein